MFNKKAVCQSCGMSLKEEGGGTNKDGTESDEYCSHCYQEGVFTQPAITVAQMREQVKEKLREYRIPGILRTHFTRNIPKLRRWKH